MRAASRSNSSGQRRDQIDGVGPVEAVERPDREGVQLLLAERLGLARQRKADRALDERDRLHDGVEVERPVEAGEALAGLLDGLVSQRGLEPHGRNAQQHEVRCAAERAVGNAHHLLEIEKWIDLGRQGRGFVDAGAPRRFPGRRGGDMKDDWRSHYVAIFASAPGYGCLWHGLLDPRGANRGGQPVAVARRVRRELAGPVVDPDGERNCGSRMRRGQGSTDLATTVACQRSPTTSGRRGCGRCRPPPCRSPFAAPP